MKKIIFLLAFLVIPFTVKAEVPNGIMGFLDGKLYNISDSSLAYICFMDGNCYDKEMKLAFNRGGISVPAYTPAIIGSNVDVPVPVTLPIPTPIINNQTTMPNKTQVDIKTLINFSTSANKFTINIYDSIFNNLRKIKSLSQIGDTFSLTINGQTYTQTLNSITEGKYYPVGDTFMNFALGDKWLGGIALTPGTDYPYTLRIYRGNTYGETSGIVTTLAE